MVSKNRGICGFLGPSWVLITMAPVIYVIYIIIYIILYISYIQMVRFTTIVPYIRYTFKNDNHFYCIVRCNVDLLHNVCKGLRGLIKRFTCVVRYI